MLRRKPEVLDVAVAQIAVPAERARSAVVADDPFLVEHDPVRATRRACCGHWSAPVQSVARAADEERGVGDADRERGDQPDAVELVVRDGGIAGARELAVWLRGDGQPREKAVPPGAAGV